MRANEAQDRCQSLLAVHNLKLLLAGDSGKDDRRQRDAPQDRFNEFLRVRVRPDILALIGRIKIELVFLRMPDKLDDRKGRDGRLDVWWLACLRLLPFGGPVIGRWANRPALVQSLGKAR